MLLPSRRHTERDLYAWRAHERTDDAWSRTQSFARLVAAAHTTLTAFVAGDPGYIGVSWGKDSVCVAHLAHAIGCTWPLVWVCMQPVDNPDCPAVRDAFLARWPMAYDEIVMQHDASARRTSAPGFAEAARRHGDRYVSGVRGAESAKRRLSVATHGAATNRACRPLAHWSAADVYAYLYTHGLPVHPAYAMSVGGMLDREHLRVGALGGQRGRGWGRAEWEERYYGAELRAIERAIERGR